MASLAACCSLEPGVLRTISNSSKLAGMLNKISGVTFSGLGMSLLATRVNEK
ncbi:hypothetical protein [Undibacterium sp. SXout20W]|uniref:hypothetical protein n=1 Tax=Undibacterium sp. SXout20W TaxID=3413051 RepID=UPI003BF60070